MAFTTTASIEELLSSAMDSEEFGLYVSEDSSHAPTGQEFVLPAESRDTAEAESAAALAAYWREEAEESDLHPAAAAMAGGGGGAATEAPGGPNPGEWQLGLSTGPPASPVTIILGINTQNTKRGNRSIPLSSMVKY